ncbi:MAG: hypothetical protein ACQET3_06965, partial [Promethearchaeati archaeon]
MGEPSSRVTHYCPKLQTITTVTTTGVEPESQIGFLGILFAIIISALVIAYALKWYLHDWREKAIEEPFEPAEDLSIWSFLR